MPRVTPALLTTAACLACSGPLAAQDPAPAEPERVTIVGFVLDGFRGTPLPGALVRLVDHDLGALSDERGRFVLEDVAVGRQLFSIRQYGYVERLIERPIEAAADTADADAWYVRLQPSPAAIEGFEVVADNLATMERRLKRRRNATPVAVRTVDRERLLHSASSDLFQMLTTEANVRPNPCPTGSAYEWCILRRGRLMQMDLFVDERPAMAGMDELRDYHPLDIYLVEVYSGGLQVRVYTHAFMERMARRPMALLPVLWR